MAREQYNGQCEKCGHSFRWYLIHNGFNSSCHAYCSRCGAAAILSLYAAQANAFPGGITPDIELLLAACSCGGRFLAGATPRCPSCSEELSAQQASNYIEPATPASAEGWRWQKLWNGGRALYAMVIDNRQIEDPFIDQS
jgi:hypothetical protein